MCIPIQQRWFIKAHVGNWEQIRSKKRKSDGEWWFFKKKKEVNSQIPLTGATSAERAAVTLR